MLFHFRQFACAGVYAVVFVLCCSTPSSAQNTSTTIPPVLDVHVHAMDESFPGGPMCPNESKFLASDPSTKEATNGWSQEECTPKLYPAAKGEYLKDVVAEMERLNVTAVVFGDPEERAKVERRCPKPRHPRYVVQCGHGTRRPRPARRAPQGLHQRWL